MLSPPIFSGIAKTIYGTYMKRSPSSKGQTSLLFMIFLVLVVMPITLSKQKERCMKEQLSMLGE